ncbi:28132_t:CDS:1, partial [Gigaspora margarita]
MYTKKKNFTIVCCNNCRYVKVKCIGGIPCERCKKRNFDCTYSSQQKRGPKKAASITRPCNITQLHSLAQDIHNSNRMDNKDATFI